MSGIPRDITFTINRISVQFADDLGNTESIQGTGFWIKLDSGKTAFVTNKHNIDAKLKFGDSTNLKWTKIGLERRKFLRKGVAGICHPQQDTKFFEIDGQTKIYSSVTADCTIIFNPTFIELDSDYEAYPIKPISEIADETFFNEKISIMDWVSFIGFAKIKIIKALLPNEWTI